MKLRTFQARTMAEALEQVKRQFGRDAVILNTRTRTKGGLFGIGGKPYVEITATADDSDLPRPFAPGSVTSRSGRGNRAEGAASPMPVITSARSSPASEFLLSEVGTLKTMVTDLLCETRRSQLGKLPGELYATYQRLVQNAVADEIASALIDGVRRQLTDDQLHDAQAVRRQLATALKAMLPTAGPIRTHPGARPHVVALIGPTGVGKTTTVAKLAANFCLRARRKVGLITVDTYRIAAVEQLKTYAQIIDVPLEVAMSPEELKDAVGRMADRDVILVDTAGRSQRDAMKIQELRGFFNALRPHEVHLVLSTACTEKVLTETIERFGVIGVDRVIFTKLDEALGFGVILSCLQKVKAQLSYVTTGQDVPDDIEVGESAALAELILGTEDLRPAAGKRP